MKDTGKVLEICDEDPELLEEELSKIKIIENDIEKVTLNITKLENQ